MTNLVIAVLALDLIYHLSTCSTPITWPSFQEISREFRFKVKKVFSKLAQNAKSARGRCDD